MKRKAQTVKSEVIRDLARAEGFELAGVASAEPTPESLIYPQWLDWGYAGEMDYLKGRRGQMRADPRNLLPTAKSLICVGLVYNTPDPGTAIPNAGQARISRYARGRDYHDVMRPKLHGLADRMRELAGPFDYKVCVDTAPLLERAYAHHAGLGWIGKNTCLINQQLGSWVFLGELLTSLEIEPGTPAPFRCGTCTRCIEACPTDALVPTGKPEGPAFALDSRRCISYFTIELRGAIPEENRAEIGAHVFGCDICQDVCPWNRRAAMTQSEEFQPLQGAPDLTDLAGLTEAEFNERFSGTPIERSRHQGFLRNVAVAMGNSSDPKLLEPLRKLAGSEDAIVSKHAQWAMERIQAPGTEARNAALRDREDIAPSSQ